MNTDPIRFGTDGWRAVLGRDFTFANLTRIARATAAWLYRQPVACPTVVVGCDARFMGEMFARHAAEVLAAEGVAVVLAPGITPTPAVSWAAAGPGIDAGIVITASHNAPEYNGYKIKTGMGTPATEDITLAIEAAAAGLYRQHDRSAGSIEVRDIRGAYLDYLRQQFDTDAMRDAGIHAVHDAMYGAGRGCFLELLGRNSVAEIRSVLNPGFGGIVPEPIERNLGVLTRAVARRESTVGIANDGDADRIGVMDETGSMVSSQNLFALLVKYLHQERGLSGAIVKTVSTTGMLDRMGRAYGLSVETCPIGFKHIAPRMAAGDVLVGGEESGGIAFRGHIPDRDGIYAGLLLLELLAVRGRKLSVLVQELTNEFGVHAYRRADIRTKKKAEILLRLRTDGGLRHIAGYPVGRVETLDGYKHITEAGWLLVRPSGTEPLLRIYAEAETEDVLVLMMQDALAQLGLS